MIFFFIPTSNPLLCTLFFLQLVITKRLRHVTVHPPLRQVSQRKSPGLPDRGLWLLQSETRVSVTKKKKKFVVQFGGWWGILWVSHVLFIFSRHDGKPCYCFSFIFSLGRKEDGTLRTMPADKLLKTLPALQGQIDALLEFDCSANDLTNGVVNTAFLLLFRDLIRLFACYNDGIINLLGQFLFWKELKNRIRVSI